MLTTDDVRSTYEHRLRELLKDLYSYGDQRSEARANLSQRIGGFLEAASVTCLFEPDELQQIVDAVHMATFGQSLQESKQELQLGRKVEISWDAYDTPTFKRRKGSMRDFED